MKQHLGMVLIVFCAAYPQAAYPESANQPREERTGVSAVNDSGAAMIEVKEYIAEMTAANKIDKSSDGWKTNLPKFKPLSFAKDKSYYWHLTTNHGDIKVKFLPEVAPNHVANFIYLTELGFFDSVGFHRVITGFMAQGGDPTGTGRGSPGYRFAGEFDPAVKHDRPGLLSMANAGPNTDGSQFFLTFVETNPLNGKHTIFGEIEDGMDTMRRLEQRGSRSGRPSEPLSIERAWISIE